MVYNLFILFVWFLCLEIGSPNAIYSTTTLDFIKNNCPIVYSSTFESLTSRTKRGGGYWSLPHYLIDPRSLWTTKTIPYKISTQFSSEQHSTIQSAIQEFHTKTCIRFQEHTNATDTNYVNIMPSSLIPAGSNIWDCNGCDCDFWANNDSYRPPNQPLWIETSCVQFGYVLHRLMHALGYDDEHIRNDRDDWIEVDQSNIQGDKRKAQFEKLPGYKHSSESWPYAYDTIMHQGPYWLSDNPAEKTLIAKKEGAENMGQRAGLSKTDLQRINFHWGCKASDPTITTPLPSEPTVTTPTTPTTTLPSSVPFEGDIEGISEDDFELRNGIYVMSNAAQNKSQLWESGVVPYTITGVFNERQLKMINDAMEEYRQKTCIKFVKWEGQKDYIDIVSPPGGCSSEWGRRGGAQKVNLAQIDCFKEVGIVIHELMHAIGFVHEQSRTDRDDWIDIHWDNIYTGMIPSCDNYRQFMRYSVERITKLGFDYDYESVLHYGPFDDSIKANTPGKETITPKKPLPAGKMGQRKGFSPTDIQKIRKLYNCPENEVTPERTTTQSPGSPQTQKPGGVHVYGPGFNLKIGFVKKPGVSNGKGSQGNAKGKRKGKGTKKGEVQGTGKGNKGKGNVQGKGNKSKGSVQGKGNKGKGSVQRKGKGNEGNGNVQGKGNKGKGSVQGKGKGNEGNGNVHGKGNKLNGNVQGKGNNGKGSVQGKGKGVKRIGKGNKGKGSIQGKGKGNKGKGSVQGKGTKGKGKGKGTRRKGTKGKGKGKAQGNGNGKGKSKEKAKKPTQGKKPALRRRI